MTPQPGDAAPARVSSLTFRLPRSAYLLALVVAIGLTAAVQHPVLAVLYVIPLLVVVYIARISTRVGPEGITVGAFAGSRLLPWDEVRGLSVVERSVYAVVPGGLVRLPCVRVADLHLVAALSGGRLPQVAPPTPKFAPSRRSRR